MALSLQGVPAGTQGTALAVFRGALLDEHGRYRLIKCGAPSMVFLLALSLFIFSVKESAGQCAGTVSSPRVAADCAARETPREGTAILDPAHPYTLAELIDVAEHHNPSTRTIWERAKQRARELGLAKSAYYPELEGLAVSGDQRSIEPFPKPLSPRGYIMVEVPFVEPEVTLQYLIFDFGKRGATVGSARAEKLAAGAEVIQANQALAFRVASAYSQSAVMAPLVAQIYAHRQTIEIGAKLTARMLFSGARCCHLFRIQLFLQLSHQFCQHFLGIPLHRAPRLRTLRRQFTILSRVAMLLQGRSP
jgi:hypothetical protein